MKQIAHFTLLILVLNVCFLFSPKPTPETAFCGEYISLNTYAGFSRNCDANEFLESAIDPSALIREGYVRQNRPLYVIAASGIGYCIYGIVHLLYAADVVGLENCMYIAYVCLNFIVLLLALILFGKVARIVTDDKIPYTLILILSVFIASNFMTKAFFWTVHQQMLAFLMPLLGMYVSIKWIKGKSIQWLYALCFMLGIGMLVYGSFLILFTVCMLYFCYNLYIQKMLFTVRSITHIGICCLLFMITTILWILFLKYKGVAYYNHEVVRYRQLVWMKDTLLVSTSEFLSALYANVLQFLKTTSKLYVFAAFVWITILVRKIRTGTYFQFNDNTNLILLNLCCFGVFFIVLGYYADRLTFTLMPILLCLSIANAGEMLTNKKVQLFLLITATTWHLINVATRGPFS